VYGVLLGALFCHLDPNKTYYKYAYTVDQKYCIMETRGSQWHASSRNVTAGLSSKKRIPDRVCAVSITIVRRD